MKSPREKMVFRPIMTSLQRLYKGIIYSNKLVPGHVNGKPFTNNPI